MHEKNSLFNEIFDFEMESPAGYGMLPTFPGNKIDDPDALDSSAVRNLIADRAHAMAALDIAITEALEEKGYHRDDIVNEEYTILNCADDYHPYILERNFSEEYPNLMSSYEDKLDAVFATRGDDYGWDRDKIARWARNYTGHMPDYTDVAHDAIAENLGCYGLDINDIIS